jgi:hypothetical protein
VVEAFHGPDWYVNERYAGPTTFDYPQEGTPTLATTARTIPEPPIFRLSCARGTGVDHAVGGGGTAGSSLRWSLSGGRGRAVPRTHPFRHHTQRSGSSCQLVMWRLLWYIYTVVIMRKTSVAHSRRG